MTQEEFLNQFISPLLILFIGWILTNYGVSRYSKIKEENTIIESLNEKLIANMKNFSHLEYDIKKWNILLRDGENDVNQLTKLQENLQERLIDLSGESLFISSIIKHHYKKSLYYLTKYFAFTAKASEKMLDLISAKKSIEDDLFKQLNTNQSTITSDMLEIVNQLRVKTYKFFNL